MFRSIDLLRPFIRQTIVRERAPWSVKQLSTKAFATVSGTDAHSISLSPSPRVVVLGTGWGGFNLVRFLTSCFLQVYGAVFLTLEHLPPIGSEFE
jgi:hypothetical protein